MAHAVTLEWISHDPAAHIDPPAQKVIVAVTEGDIWTPAQMSAFLDHVADHRLGGCFALTLLGLRREEAGGLRWLDIDLERPGTFSSVAHGGRERPRGHR